ncbi:MAG: agmatine deiminase family protein [Phycisphaeraceae bacterium]|nr:agmatine deiminase family protein [Phycisphaeraceae bacterium]
MSYRVVVGAPRSRGILALLSLVAASGLAGAGAPSAIHAEGEALPRFMTKAERDFVRDNPIVAPRAVTPPSDYPGLRTVAEYEPMDAIIFSWQGSASWLSIIAQMSGRITTVGDANVVVYAASASAASSAQSQIAAQGADMSRVDIRIRSLNSIWMRDYGPRYVYEGDVRSIVDHTYNRPRPADNLLPSFHGQQFNHTVYEMPLVHGGGNYHLDANGVGYATRLINNENPGLTEPQIIGIWQDYQNLGTRLYQPFPTSVDATQHIDMWIQVIADNKVIISDWPLQSGSTQDLICDAAAVDFANRGFTVYRTPAVATGGTHYTFTNMVMCNDLVLLPSYTNTTVVNNNFNQQALATLQAALPDKTIVQIPCQAIVTAAGVMHCIVMHMPRHLGGDNPTALVRFPNGGEQLTPGDSVEIRWDTDDRQGVLNVDLLLSTDGGATFPTVIASALPDTGSYMWAVPNTGTTNALVRVRPRNLLNNTGHDDSDAVFAILGGCPGDTNGDNLVNFADLNAVLSEFGQTGAPGFSPSDLNNDGAVNFADLNAVLSAFGSDCN